LSASPIFYTLREYFLYGNFLMQRFTLLHDGSDQAWRTVYLAFQVAAPLGAPLQVLLVEPVDKEISIRNAAQVEIGGRAAGVAVETVIAIDLSLDAMMVHVKEIDGLFLPRHLASDEKIVSRFLEAFSCPLWAISNDSRIRNPAVLVNDMKADAGLVQYATRLSMRLNLPLTGLARALTPGLHVSGDSAPLWKQVQQFTPGGIASTLDQLDVGLCFVPASAAWLVEEVLVNCVVFPGPANA
jgi:hypothetical protein